MRNAAFKLVAEVATEQMLIYNSIMLHKMQVFYLYSLKSFVRSEIREIDFHS